MKTSLGLLAAAGLLAACGSNTQTASGPSQQGTGRTCFRPSEVAGWSSGRMGTINLRTDRNDYYQAKMIPACHDLDMSQQLAIQSRFGQMICVGGEADVVVPRSVTGGPEHCRIDDIRKLAPEEVAALPPADKP